MKLQYLSLKPQKCDYFIAELDSKYIFELSEPTGWLRFDDSKLLKNFVHLNSAADAWRDAQQSGFIGGGYSGFEAANLAGPKGVPTPKCSREEMEAGWFDPADLTNAHSPLIVDIAVEVEGKTYEVYTAYSPDTELRYKLGKPAMERNVKAALEKAHRILAEKIDADQAASTG